MFESGPVHPEKLSANISFREISANKQRVKAIADLLNRGRVDSTAREIFRLGLTCAEAAVQSVGRLGEQAPPSQPDVIDQFGLDIRAIAQWIHDRTS
jgi:hypothetical protein